MRALPRQSTLFLLFELAVWSLACSGQAWAFYPIDRWINTASGSASSRGNPVTLTWSLVPDGTSIPNFESSNLIAMFDERFGTGPGGDDLMARPWFSLVESAFARWSELGGVTFVYEPHDDGAMHQNSAGELGVRGDVRLAMVRADGSGGQLAFSQYPDTGDIVLDMADLVRFTNPDGNYLVLRNLLMHEIGHTLGLDHVLSSDTNILMEPLLSLSFDGPQLDDIRGLHHLYGDRMEQTGGGVGNDTLANAVNLGILARDDTISLGSDAGPDVVVEATDTDFLSITRRTDLDFFSIEILEPAWLDLTLTPWGGTFYQALVGDSELLTDASAKNDLTLAVFAADTTQIAAINEQPRGGVETLMDLYLPAPGRYTIRIRGIQEVVQLYELNIHLHGTPLPEPSAVLLGIPLCLLAAAWYQRPSR